MKLHFAIVPLITMVVLAGSAFAGKPMWPKQMKLSSAYESLQTALKQVEKSRGGDSAKHLANASAALASARVDLDTAAKNKGSARVAAMDLIDQAKGEIDASKTDANKLDSASATITKAMEKVTRAAQNGR